MKYVFKSPQYMNDFKCIGKECELDCCRGWVIYWRQKEIDKLKERAAKGCSDELAALIESSFVPDEERSEGMMRIRLLDDDDDCPFHDKADRLCMIQKELGEDCLSTVCKDYPRRRRLNDGIVCQSCSISCPAVYDLAISAPEACDMYVSKGVDDITGIFVTSDTNKMVKENPALKYRNRLFDFFYNILSDKKRDIKTSVLLGALAASKLSEFEKRTPDRIPEVINALLPQISSAATAKALSDIKPNYALKIGVVQSLFRYIAAFGDSHMRAIDDITTALRALEVDENGKASTDAYVGCLDRFMGSIGKNEHMLRNIMRTFYLDLEMPLHNIKYTLFENYAYYTIVCAAVEYLAAAAAAKCGNEKDMLRCFKEAVCVFAHITIHNKSTVEKTIDLLNSQDCLSTAHLALIIN